MNHDAAHCADWNKEKCPDSCYRAALTKEVKERQDLWYVPLSYIHFANTSECERKDDGNNKYVNTNE